MNAQRLVAIVAGALSCTPLAAAQTQDAERLRPKWQALDANHDGRVTLEELHPILAASLKSSDHDGDGVITLAEYVNFDLDPGGSAARPLPANVREIPNLSYVGTSDPRQEVDLYLPKKATVHGPLPIIAFVHGGGWSMGSKIMARGETMSLVDSGRYAVVSIGYRLSWQSKWPAQLYDVKAGIRWIRAHAHEYGLDPNRICAMGSSAGGHLVTKLGLTNGLAAAEGTLGPNLRQSSRVQCVIDEFGPTDLEHFDVGPPTGQPTPVDELLGGRSADRPSLARSASPLLDVNSKAPPFLIIHGSKDPLVDYRQSVALDLALRRAGVPVLFQTINGGGHGDFGAALSAVQERIRLFLEKNFYDRSVRVPTDTLAK